MGRLYEDKKCYTPLIRRVTLMLTAVCVDASCLLVASHVSWDVAGFSAMLAVIVLELSTVSLVLGEEVVVPSGWSVVIPNGRVQVKVVCG